MGVGEFFIIFAIIIGTYFIVTKILSMIEWKMKYDVSVKWYAKTNYEAERYSKSVDALKVQCKICGRKMPFFLNEDRKICDWCKHYVYKNDKAEFKYKVKGAIINERKRVQEANKRKES